MSPDDVKEKARFCIWYIELPADMFDPKGPQVKGYTWRQGLAYEQLRHIVQWATRVLHAEGLRQEASKKARNALSVEQEWIEGAQTALGRITEEVGSVLLSQWYQPKEEAVGEGDEEELALIPCPLCHI